MMGEKRIATLGGEQNNAELVVAWDSRTARLDRGLNPSQMRDHSESLSPLNFKP